MPDCGLKVFNESGELARDLRVSLDEPIDQPALDLVQKQCLQGMTCSYAMLEVNRELTALYLHSQLLPPAIRIFGTRRRATGRWLTHRLELGIRAGGRGLWGPECFFRQTDIDAERAWLTPLLLRLRPSLASRAITLANGDVWSWEFRDERFFYRDNGPRWALYGAGNTPLLRMEQALHLANPTTAEDYLWAIGAIPMGRPRKLKPAT